ncbi:MAG: hypothetical protein ACYS1A_10440 [Planctomycetota bacterium]|jgi:hypothetical protein
MSEVKKLKLKPGVCIAWEQKLKELAEISGDEELIRKVWEDNEALAYMYIWHCLLSF